MVREPCFVAVVFECRAGSIAYPRFLAALFTVAIISAPFVSLHHLAFFAARVAAVSPGSTSYVAAHCRVAVLANAEFFGISRLRSGRTLCRLPRFRGGAARLATAVCGTANAVPAPVAVVYTAGGRRGSGTLLRAGSVAVVPPSTTPAFDVAAIVHVALAFITVSFVLPTRFGSRRTRGGTLVTIAAHRFASNGGASEASVVAIILAFVLGDVFEAALGGRAFHALATTLLPIVFRGAVRQAHGRAFFLCEPGVLAVLCAAFMFRAGIALAGMSL